MSNSIDNVKLESTVFQSIELLLAETEVKGSEISKIVINTNNFDLFDSNGKLIVRLIESVGKIDMDLVTPIIERIQLVRLKETKDANGKVDGRKYIVAYTNVTAFDENSDIQGKQAIINKEVIYFDKCYESNKNGVTKNFVKKHIDNSVDFAIHTLLKEGYRKGVLNTKSFYVYGVEDNNSFKRLNRVSLSTDTGIKLLNFEKLNINAKKGSIKMSVNETITVPSISQLRITKELKKCLKYKSGIIIINDLIIDDLINAISDLADGTNDVLNILHVGTGRPTVNHQNIKVEQIISGSEVARSVRNTNYSFIVDDDNNLSIDEIIKISESQLLVIGSDITNAVRFFQKFDDEPKPKFVSFVNKIIYMGDIYKRIGIELTDYWRERIKEGNEFLLQQFLDVEPGLDAIVSQILVKTNNNIKQIYSNNKRIFVEDNNRNIAPVAGITCNDSMILEYLTSRPLTQKDDVMKSLEQRGRYTTIIKFTNPKNRMDKKFYKLTGLMKSTGVSFTIYPIVVSYDHYKVKDANDLNMLIFTGPNKSGKTSMSKSNLNITSKDKIYVFDRDYDYFEGEFPDAQYTSIERNKFDEELIKRISPTILVINSYLDMEDLMKLIPYCNTSRIIINMDKTLYEKFIETYMFKSYQEYGILKYKEIDALKARRNVK